MKNLYFFHLLILSCLSSQAFAWAGEPPTSFSEARISEGTSPDDSITLIIDSVSTMIIRKEMRKGKLHGGYYSKDLSTGIVVEARYLNGNLHGDFVKRNVFSGHLLSRGQYFYGKKVGAWTFYHLTTGKIKEQVKFMGSDEAIEEHSFYNEEGFLIKDVLHQNGGKLQQVTFYHPGNSKIKRKTFTVDWKGSYESPIRIYGPTGQLEREISIKGKYYTEKEDTKE
ncbi:MAG: hypothetical protein H6581_27860 [Bacteroidia bacterium]|nr:hypothetical protein [Bacteroidia bacterium]